MAREIRTIETVLEMSDENMWLDLAKEFDKNPDLIQRLSIDCGDDFIGRMVVTMHMNEDGSGYFQFEDITPIEFGEKMLERCENVKGGIFPGGIYRFPFGSS